MNFPGLDAVATPVMIVDITRTIRYVNPSTENLFNISSKTLIDSQLETVFLKPRAIHEIINLAANNHCTFRSICKAKSSLSGVSYDSDDLELSTTATPTDVLGISGFMLEFQIINDQLKKAQQDEQMINQNQRNHELIRNLAHEIRNPLGGLRGAAQLLATDNTNNHAKKCTEIIISEADRLQKLLDRLLVPIKLPTIESFNIHQILRRVKNLVLAEYQDAIKFHEKFDVSIPHLEGDKEQIMQAILNIVQNSAQAISKSGDITLSTQIERKVSLLKKIYPLAINLKIHDNGPGIPEDIKNKIFFPLISGREGGTGLGLFLAQKLINENQGTVNMTSSPGNTVFSILLPIFGRPENGKN